MTEGTRSFDRRYRLCLLGTLELLDEYTAEGTTGERYISSAAAAQQFDRAIDILGHPTPCSHQCTEPGAGSRMIQFASALEVRNTSLRRKRGASGANIPLTELVTGNTITGVALRFQVIEV